MCPFHFRQTRLHVRQFSTLHVLLMPPALDCSCLECFATPACIYCHSFTYYPWHCLRATSSKISPAPHIQTAVSSSFESLKIFKITFIIFFLVENEYIYTVFFLLIKLAAIKKSNTVVPSYPQFYFPCYQLPVGNHSLKTLMEKSRYKQLISFKLCTLLSSVMKSCTTCSIPLGKWIIPLSSISPQMLILRVYFKKIKYLEQFWIYPEMQMKLNTRK